MDRDSFFATFDDSDDDNPLPMWFDGEGSLAPYQHCTLETALACLNMADVTKNDVVYDIGCGDGRICVIASKLFGCRSVGIEKFYFEKCQATHEKLTNIKELVEFRNEDALECNLDDCTVSLAFLLPDGLEAIKPRIEEILRRGGRHVSLLWEMKGWKPVKTCQTPNGIQTLYLYTKDSLPINI